MFNDLNNVLFGPIYGPHRFKTLYSVLKAYDADRQDLFAEALKKVGTLEKINKKRLKFIVGMLNQKLDLLVKEREQKSKIFTELENIAIKMVNEIK